MAQLNAKIDKLLEAMTTISAYKEELRKKAEAERQAEEDNVLEAHSALMGWLEFGA